MSKIDPSQQVDKGCVLIVEAGHLLSCNDVTICKGMLIYHRYQKVKKEYEFYFYLFATASLNLSIQVCEEPIKPEDVLKVFKSLGMQVKEDFCKEDVEQKLMDLQFDIYRVVFDRPYREVPTKTIADELSCETAHKYVFPYLRLVASYPDVQKNLISVQTWTLRLLFTFYHCRRCTYYEALEIALAALSLAFYQYRLDPKHLKLISKEIDTSVNDVNVSRAMDDMVMVSDIGTENVDYSLT